MSMAHLKFLDIQGLEIQQILNRFAFESHLKSKIEDSRLQSGLNLLNLSRLKIEDCGNELPESSIFNWRLRVKFESVLNHLNLPRVKSGGY